MGHHHGGGVGCCCELCGALMAVHCASDAAFLCDSKVLGVNSLVSRHRRTRLLLAVVGSPAPAPDEDGYEFTVTSCVPTTDSVAPRWRHVARAPARSRSGSSSPSPGARADAVLEGWAKRTGLASGSEARRRAAAAAWVLLACAHDLASTRVAMAAALCREVAGHGRIGGGGGGGGGLGEALRCLEACAHVPARLVLAVATSQARARARRREGRHRRQSSLRTGGGAQRPKA